MILVVIYDRFVKFKMVIFHAHITLFIMFHEERPFFIMTAWAGAIMDEYIVGFPRFSRISTDIWRNH